MKIGERMKVNYEDRQRYCLTRRTPVIIRVDGKAFHTYTRNLHKPFCQLLVNGMVLGAKAVMDQAQGCKLAYVQSDEASFLLTDYDQLTTEAWFGYVKSKVETIAASVMTAEFNWAMSDGKDKRLAHFDARAFNLPREEVANYFVWRALDWSRNSVAMYCGSFFSAKQMHGQGRADQHELLHGIGKNWATDLPAQLRNGTFILPGGYERADILPAYDQIAAIVETFVNCDRTPANIHQSVLVDDVSGKVLRRPAVETAQPAATDGGAA